MGLNADTTSHLYKTQSASVCRMLTTTFLLAINGVTLITW